MEPVLTAASASRTRSRSTTYLADGGYAALRKVLRRRHGRPEQLTEEVKKSGLRGRGGAGFPTGREVGLPPEGHEGQARLPALQRGRVGARHVQGPAPHGERPAPGDRGDDPRGLRHQVQDRLHLHPRRVLRRRAHPRTRAIAEAYAKGFLGENILGSGFTLDITVHRGAGAYICGEETGLIESLEGKRGQPRIKPPFPAVSGVFGCPTIVNNVETLACVDAHRQPRAPSGSPKIGRNEKNTGPKLFCVSGHVNRPGVYEAADGPAAQGAHLRRRTTAGA